MKEKIIYKINEILRECDIVTLDAIYGALVKMFDK